MCPNGRAEVSEVPWWQVPGVVHQLDPLLARPQCQEAAGSDQRGRGWISQSLMAEVNYITSSEIPELGE